MLQNKMTRSGRGQEETKIVFHVKEEDDCPARKWGGRREGRLGKSKSC